MDTTEILPETRVYGVEIAYVKRDNDGQNFPDSSIRIILIRQKMYMCDKVHDTRDVDLSGIVDAAETKRVTLSGSGGSMSGNS